MTLTHNLYASCLIISHYGIKDSSSVLPLIMLNTAIEVSIYPKVAKAWIWRLLKNSSNNCLQHQKHCGMDNNIFAICSLMEY